MKAAVVTEGYNLEVWDIPEPEPGDYEVLCRITYGSTCAGTDLRLLCGGHPNPVSYPAVLGHESVGRVIAVGKEVKNFKEGDLITRVGMPPVPELGLGVCWGGFSEYGIAKDHWEMRKNGEEKSLWDKNRVNQVVWREIEEKDAPLIITMRETLSYYRRLGIPDGSNLLVIGSGANSLAFVRYGALCGCQVIAVGSKKRKTLFEKAGAAVYLDYKEENLKERLYEIAGGAIPLDGIIDGVGSSEILNEFLGMLKKDGSVGIYGWNDRKKSGIHVFSAQRSFRVYAGGYDEEETHAEVCALFAAGKIDASYWYDKDNPVALTEIGSAYERLKSHEAMKYLIRM